MVKWFINFWNIHGIIGKALDILIVSLFVFALIGIPLGFTYIIKANDVTYTNIFLNEEFNLHGSDYNACVNSAFSLEEIAILNKDEMVETKEGHFVGVNLSISQISESRFGEHVFDKDDFKLKDHTGVIIPMNDIAGMVGWNAIDIHYNPTDEGYVISSADFSTRNAVIDYNYIGKTINASQTVEFYVYFPMPSNLLVENELMVLEIDLYSGWWGEYVCVDVILLSRPGNL